MSLVSEKCTVNGRTTEYLTAGDGDPLVFLHGGGLVEGFEPLEPLTKQFRVIVPIMPGFMSTDLNPAITSRDEMSAHIVGVFDELGVEQTVLVGHSVGGWLAANISAKFSDRVSKLVLACPYGFDVEGEGLAPVFMMTPEEERLALTNDQSVWEGKIPTGPDAAFDAARELEGQSLGGFMPGPFDPEAESIAATVKQPTLILWGDDDKIIPAGHAPVWESAIPNAELKMYPGAGHLIFHERGEAVDAVAEFAAS